eukprot:scaffold54796_cov44-Phaeocystis_antarctica.AAC.1
MSFITATTLPMPLRHSQHHVLALCLCVCALLCVTALGCRLAPSRRRLGLTAASKKRFLCLGYTAGERRAIARSGSRAR